MNIEKESSVDVVASKFSKMSLIPATMIKKNIIESTTFMDKICIFFFTKYGQVDRACRSELQPLRLKSVQIKSTTFRRYFFHYYSRKILIIFLSKSAV